MNSLGYNVNLKGMIMNESAIAEIVSEPGHGDSPSWRSRNRLAHISEKKGTSPKTWYRAFFNIGKLEVALRQVDLRQNERKRDGKFLQFLENFSEGYIPSSADNPEGANDWAAKMHKNHKTRNFPLVPFEQELTEKRWRRARSVRGPSRIFIGTLRKTGRKIKVN